ncbi:MAG TPA: hypothetical protein VGY54_13035 [Polyangiaceae bacterium]|nr:hypothetical protein [Polyangiaceae bacterium]
MASKIDFFGLPRPVQDRFAAATRRSAPPAPLLFMRAPRTVAWALLAASGALMLVELVVLRMGWGDVNSSLAIHGPLMIAFESILLGLAAYGVLHAMAILVSLESLPFRAGTYLFPACAIEARGQVLQVWPVSDIESVDRVTAPSPGLELRMRDRSRVVIPARSAKDAERAQSALEPIRKELARALADGDPHALAELDPLHDSAMSSPIGPTERMQQSIALWTRFDWAIAAVIGLVVGHVLGATRNSISDDAIYRTVVAGGTEEAYRAYLKQGGRHSEEIENVLLPHAELQSAEARGSVDALREFTQTHPSSKIGSEIEAAMRRALLVDLDKAKQAGTVTALDDFARGNTEPYVATELKAARHALFQQALAAWKKKARADAATSAFMDRLFAWSEGHGPVCELRFRYEPSASLEDADGSVRKSGHYPGNDALPSNYVTAPAFRPREQRVAEAIAQGFATAFPADVLSIRAAEPLAADAPPPMTPTLLVVYNAEWARAIAACPKPDTVFAGFIFAYNAAFSVVDGKPPMKIAVKAWRGPEAWKVRSEDRTRQEFEQKVYDAMIDGAFDQLQRKLVDVLF